MYPNDSHSPADDLAFEPSEDLIALYKQHVPVYICELNAAIESDDMPGALLQSQRLRALMKQMRFTNIVMLLDSLQKENLQGEALHAIVNKIEAFSEHTLILLSKEER